MFRNNDKKIWSREDIPNIFDVRRIDMINENIKDKLKGSGILVVILSSIVFFIYSMSTFSEQEYFSILQNKYEKDIVKQYESNINDIDSYYDRIASMNVQ
jgi:Na+-transporting methylmalonyl-CoA/oxaloacetate decarboxylase gamma subunit